MIGGEAQAAGSVDVEVERAGEIDAGAAQGARERLARVLQERRKFLCDAGVGRIVLGRCVNALFHRQP